jgi:excisionase family DNA binding protein
MPASPRQKPAQSRTSPRIHWAPGTRDWKTPNQAAEYAGVCVKTIRRRILDGTLPAQRFGPRLLRVDRADLDRLFTPVPAAGNGR